MSEERCVCCGEIIPEGIQVCPNCMLAIKQDEGKDDNGKS